MKDFKLTYENEYKKVYASEKENKKGEKIIIEVSKCFYDNTHKNSLPNLWKKNCYTDHLYNSVIWIDCEVTDKEAEKIAAAWVETYKKNGTYMFDYA